MKMTEKAKSTDKLNFEKALTDLEKIVNDLESGDLSLEDSIKAFEKGIELSKLCQKKLEAAENRVKKLLEKSGGDFDLELFEEKDSNSNE
jgi:exodeoxyribonuclease VII small subunit